MILTVAMDFRYKILRIQHKRTSLALRQLTSLCKKKKGDNLI